MPEFRVVTQKNWLAEQFKPFGAKQDFGFDINPHTALETIWWAPGAWVASAAKAGVILPLLSAGPHWLNWVPARFRGRKTYSCQMVNVPNDRKPKFIKLPEAKLENFEARVFQTDDIQSTLKQYHLPMDTMVQVQDVIEFDIEARFFIANGKVVAKSLYRIQDRIWGSPEFAAWINTDPVQAGRLLERMQKAVERVIGVSPIPPGVVIDMGITRDSKVLVVEANAAWSSGPYDCDPKGVYQAIVAAHDFYGDYPEWAWKPGSVYQKAGALKIVRGDR